MLKEWISPFCTPCSHGSPTLTVSHGTMLSQALAQVVMLVGWLLAAPNHVLTTAVSTPRSPPALANCHGSSQTDRIFILKISVISQVGFHLTHSQLHV